MVTATSISGRVDYLRGRFFQSQSSPFAFIPTPPRFQAVHGRSVARRSEGFQGAVPVVRGQVTRCLPASKLLGASTQYCPDVAASRCIRDRNDIPLNQDVAEERAMKL